MLGLLLARAGVSVLVVEKHADFLRDFRGNTLRPSTLEIKPSDSVDPMGCFDSGRIFIMLNRGDY